MPIQRGVNYEDVYIYSLFLLYMKTPWQSLDTISAKEIVVYSAILCMSGIRYNSAGSRFVEVQDTYIIAISASLTSFSPPAGFGRAMNIAPRK